MPVGRPPGALNKATAAVKIAAQKYTDEALGVLHKIMRDEKEPGSTRIAAANSLLDRGHGRPTAVVAGDPDGAPVKTSVKVEFVKPSGAVFR